MAKDIDIRKMFEDGRKKFELCLSQVPDIESDDEYVPRASVTKETPHKASVTHSVDVFNVKVEGKRGKEISFDDVYADILAKRTTRLVKTKSREELVNDLMKKSVFRPGFETLESIPPYEISKRKMLQEKRKKRESSKGENWFNMPAAEMTEEKKNDLQILQMRSALDPKQFYKKNVMKDTPKYFHVGTVVESPADFYSSRIPKKQRKRTMVDELLADADFQSYNKKRAKEIVEGYKKTSFMAHRHASNRKRKGNHANNIKYKGNHANNLKHKRKH